MAEFLTLSKPLAYDFPDDWYEIATDGHFWLEWRIAAFLHQLQDLGIPLGTPWRGLDIGCGHGLVRRQLERNCAWITDGADMREYALRESTAERGATMFYDINDRLPEFSARYDFVVLFDVLEHIPDPDGFLASVLFHLRPGGWLFINVPAFERLRSAYDTAAGHIRRYDRALMRRELGRQALDIQDLRYWGMSLVPLLIARTVTTSKKQSTREIIKRGFEPPTPALNRLMIAIMRCETAVLRRPPFGTSLLAAARKRAPA
jgi:SAM-dependent methyltransferase